MIPKIIHYCWFGGNPLPDVALKCIDSWKKFCPDYKIIEWNERNFNVNSNDYIKEAYKAKKYAFVADFARFEILLQYGGIYLDTDVEIIKPIDDFLEKPIFFGREEIDRVNPGLIFGCEAQDKFIAQMVDFYKGLQFVFDDKRKIKTIVDYTTDRLISKGWIPEGQIQVVDGIVVYPVDYFCPKSYNTGVLNIGENTYTIHHYDGSWFTQEGKKKLILQQKLNKVLGVRVGMGVGSKILGGLFYLKEQGLRETLKKIKFLS